MNFNIPLRKCLTIPFFMMLSATAQAIDYNYTSDGSAITITRYTGTDAVITIPDTIDGLPVTTLSEDTFFRNGYLTNITIPHSVTTIERMTFYSCDNLRSITIGSGVASMSYSISTSCESLEEIIVAEDNGVFSSLDGVLLSKTQTAVVLCPFAKNGSYSIPDGVTTIAKSSFSSSSLSSIIIPDSVTVIEGYGFRNCTSLASITIPDSVTTIENYALYGCTSLTNASLGNNLTSIGNSTFENCSSLKNVTLGNSVNTIGENVFKDCTSLTSIIIPDSVTAIGDSVFSGCHSLILVTIGNNVATIGQSAFYNCINLMNITIPASVTAIGDWSFSRCSNLTEITVDVANSTFSSKDGVLFNKAQTSLIQCPENKTGSYSIPNGVTNIVAGAFNPCLLTNITIPNSVITIGNSAFRSSPNLSSIVIPNSVTSTGTAVFMDCVSLMDVIIGNGLPTIEQSTFSGCDKLTTITFGSSITSVGWFAFSDCSNLETAYFEGDAPYASNSYFPSGKATVYYLLEKTGWGTTFEGNPTELWRPRIEQFTQSTEPGSHTFEFYINWANDQEIVVEASTTLLPPVWQPLKTNLLSPDSHYFSDEENSPARFYRLRMP